MEEKIDVILPTYNGEKYIKEQLESILKQTHKNIRIIISDDCSKDNTVKIIKEYEKKDNRIELYVQEQNIGVIKNIEFLLKKVESKYYMLSDQDDVWLPEKIEKSYEAMKENDADLVFGDLEVVDENLETIYPSFCEYSKLNEKIKKYIKTNKINYLYNCVTGCTILSKKKYIEKILPLPSKSKYVLHDYWIALMVSLNGKLYYMPEKYIKYRQHGNNEVGTNKISHNMNNLNEVRELFIKVKLDIFNSYIENNEKFPAELQILNVKALDYYKMLEKKKNINFEGWNIFHQLYKTEKFVYYIESFIIMNIPVIGRVLYWVKRKMSHKFVESCQKLAEVKERKN